MLELFEEFRWSWDDSIYEVFSLGIAMSDCVTRKHYTLSRRDCIRLGIIREHSSREHCRMDWMTYVVIVVGRVYISFNIPLLCSLLTTNPPHCLSPALFLSAKLSLHLVALEQPDASDCLVESNMSCIFQLVPCDNSRHEVNERRKTTRTTSCRAQLHNHRPVYQYTMPLLTYRS